MYRYKLDTSGEYKAKNKDNDIEDKTLEGYKMKNNTEQNLISH